MQTRCKTNQHTIKIENETVNLDKIEKLVKIIENSSMLDFSIQEGDVKIKMSRRGSVGAPAAPMSVSTQGVDTVESIDSEDESYITSPIVGTFYSAPSPDAKAFVKVGDRVKAGQTVCILEAMKLMNEIESDYDCEIEAVFSSIDQKVEYGEPLFYVKNLEDYRRHCMFRSILIANRGEIAVRIIRACRNMGIKSIAVYSKEDKDSLHVQLADRRVCIGEGPAKNSYLNMERIISAAKNTDADAIHPGFGFLSENADFVRLCKENGIAFIGPSAEVIDSMGNKSNARKTMMEAGVPVVPGTKEPVYDAATGEKLADEIGYPVMIKASSGGGGKGMRVSRSKEDFEFNFNTAQRESANAFGDDTMYIEKFIENPRHVEIQIMADGHGNVVALGERDCSVQRNHQKLIEESPSPAITEKIRKSMNHDAILAAKAVGYTNAGTIEFILDPKGTYYFMEMNTRIQVEHGVTEMVTGTDLIIEQIRVAMGMELSFTQEDVEINGHAIECRINAEIPEKNFMPSPGVIKHLHLPAGNGVRVDTAIYTGYCIPSEYDSMIAKVIVHAPDRDAALQKMRSALDEMVILGINTNLDFQYQMMNNREFCEGKADTGFIERLLKLD